MGTRDHKEQLLAISRIARREGVDMTEALNTVITSGIKNYWHRNGLGCQTEGCNSCGRSGKLGSRCSFRLLQQPLEER